MNGHGPLKLYLQDKLQVRFDPCSRHDGLSPISQGDLVSAIEATTRKGPLFHPQFLGGRDKKIKSIFHLSQFEYENLFLVRCWIPYNNQNRLNYDTVTTYRSQWLEPTKVYSYSHCMSVSAQHISFSSRDPDWQSLAIWRLVPVAWDRNRASCVLPLMYFCSEVTQITSVCVSLPRASHMATLWLLGTGKYSAAVCSIPSRNRGGILITSPNVYHTLQELLPRFLLHVLPCLALRWSGLRSIFPSLSGFPSVLLVIGIDTWGDSLGTKGLG